MRNFLAAFCAFVLIISSVVPLYAKPTPDDNRQQNIIEIINSIEELVRDNKTPNSVRRVAVEELVNQLTPLLKQEVDELTTQKNAVFKSTLSDLTKKTLSQSYDLLIMNLRAAQLRYNAGSVNAMLGMPADKPNNQKSSEATISNNTEITNGLNKQETADVKFRNPKPKSNNTSQNPFDTSVQSINTARNNISPDPLVENLKALMAGSILAKINSLPQEETSTDSEPDKTTNENAGKTVKNKKETKSNGAIVQEGNDDPAPDPCENKKTPAFTEVPSDGDIKIKGKGCGEYKIYVEGVEKATATANSDGYFTSTKLVSPLKKGEMITIKSLNAQNQPIETARAELEVQDKKNPEDGGIFGMLFGGVVLSQQAQDYSQYDPFFGFQIGYGSRVFGSWRNQQDSSLGMHWWAFRVNARIQGIFSTEGRTATALPSPMPTPDPDTSLQFIAGRQSFSTEASTWMEFRPLKAFSFGPYLAWGGTTVVNKNDLINQPVAINPTTTGTSTFANESRSDNDLKQYREKGVILHLRFPDYKFFTQAVLAYGKYEGLKGLDANTTGLVLPNYKENDTSRRFIGKLRIFPDGLKTSFGEQIEATPMFGVDLNAGTGNDFLRFFVGYTITLKGRGIKFVP